MIDVEAMPHLADIPRVQASIRPDEEAFWFEGETTSFAELETRSTQIANGLIGLGEGGRTSPDMVEQYIGTNPFDWVGDETTIGAGHGDVRPDGQGGRRAGL